MTPHTGGNSLRQQPRVTLSSADSSSVRRALEVRSSDRTAAHYRKRLGTITELKKNTCAKNYFLAVILAEGQLTLHENKES